MVDKHTWGQIYERKNTRDVNRQERCDILDHMKKMICTSEQYAEAAMIYCSTCERASEHYQNGTLTAKEFETINNNATIEFNRIVYGA